MATGWRTYCVDASAEKAPSMQGMDVYVGPRDQSKDHGLGSGLFVAN